MKIVARHMKENVLNWILLGVGSVILWVISQIATDFVSTKEDIREMKVRSDGQTKLLVEVKDLFQKELVDMEHKMVTVEKDIEQNFETTIQNSFKIESLERRVHQNETKLSEVSGRINGTSRDH